MSRPDGEGLRLSRWYDAAELAELAERWGHLFEGSDADLVFAGEGTMRPDGAYGSTIDRRARARGVVLP